ncbi:MAG: hypothetical protein JNM72_28280 [Deltaproteobacteria bacterium]|nr:hypothetical protein [Deltaproteobacteria bacterium]
MSTAITALDSAQLTPSVSQLIADPSTLAGLPDRALRRVLRGQPEAELGPDLPESVLWVSFLTMKGRGDDEATGAFLRSVRALLRRRTMGAPSLPSADTRQDEHKLVADATLGELWKAYKRCLCASRNGPASQLLRDIERHLGVPS